MIHTVVWTKRAEADLLTTWLAADNKAAISAASFEIDRVLRIRPEEVGEYAAEDRRLLIIRPLVVTFRVEEQDRIVRVLDVFLR